MDSETTQPAPPTQPLPPTQPVPQPQPPPPTGRHIFVTATENLGSKDQG